MLSARPRSWPSAKAFEADQFVDAACRRRMKSGTGPEIWTQSGGQIDAFVDIVGTGASFTRNRARFLRRQNASVRTYLLEPAGEAVLAGRPATEPGHKLQGAGYCRTELPLLDRSLVTDFVQVTDAEALAAARTTWPLKRASSAVSPPGPISPRRGICSPAASRRDHRVSRLRQWAQVHEH